MNKLFEVRFSKHIRKDGYVSFSSDGRAYIIAKNFTDATKKTIKVFEDWKREDKEREKHVIESITLIDDKPVF